MNVKNNLVTKLEVNDDKNEENKKNIFQRTNTIL